MDDPLHAGYGHPGRTLEVHEGGYPRRSALVSSLQVVDIRVDRTRGPLPRVTFESKHRSEQEKMTDEYDALAYRLVGYVLGVRLRQESPALTGPAMLDRVCRLLAGLLDAQVLV